MARAAVGNVHMSNKVLDCPRDRTVMTETHVGESHLDVCGKCGSQFFDAGELFGAFGVKADPSSWDHEKTGSALRESKIDCPRCNARMLTQDIKHEADSVEIDRCGKCGGIWLDKGEVEQIMAIGEKMQPIIDAEKKKAQEELDKMGTPDFSSPGLIASFLGLFKKK